MMKYTLEGFQQQKLLDEGFNIITACVLRCLVDMREGYEKRIIEDHEYFWLNQTHLVDQLPAVAKRTKILEELKKLEEKEYIIKKLKHEKNGIKGNWSYIRLTAKVSWLAEYDRPEQDLVREANKVIRNTNNPCSPDEFDLVRETNNKDLSINLSSINIIKDIVAYLNKKLGSSFRHNTKATQQHINARLAEGYTYEDFVVVIDKKYDEWINDEKMCKFLAPTTLFGPKFEKYRNQQVAKKKVAGNGRFTIANDRNFDFDMMEKLEQEQIEKDLQNKNSALHGEQNTTSEDFYKTLNEF